MISKHFSREEFKCQCGCGFSTVDVELIKVLEDVREFYNAPITITSGCRCDSHNRSVGGAEASKHKFGIACDFKVSGIEPEIVYNYIDMKYPDTYGLGLYSSWVHLDSRQDKARWSK